MADTLKEKTARGLFWGAINNGSTQVLNLVIGIFLARLLTPADYGIVGVLTIFTAIAGALQASGFTNGLINLKAPTSNDYNSVFWFNISASLVIYIILFFSAPLIASFFRQPCLVEVSRFVFLCLPVSALGISYGGYMIKNMMNKEIAIVGVFALVISGSVGIILALNGYSYWSLAWQQLSYICVVNIGRFYYVSWHPTFQIDFGPVRRMFAFCSRLLLTNIVNILNQNLLTFIFGRLFAINIVGNYSQANKWNTMAHSLVSSTLGQLSQTVLVSVKEEKGRELRVFRKLLRFTAFVSFPVMFGLALVGREFILIAIGEQWEGSIPLLQVLCLGGAFSPLYILYQHLVISAERSDIFMWCSIGQIVFQLLLILGLYPYGIMAVVTASAAANVLWLVVWQYCANRLTGLRLVDVLRDICPFMIVAIMVMAATWFLTSGISNLVLQLAARVLMASALYFVLLKLAHAVILDECLQFLFRHRS